MDRAANRDTASISPNMRMVDVSPEEMSFASITELSPAIKNQIMESMKGNLTNVLSSYHLLCTFSEGVHGGIAMTLTMELGKNSYDIIIERGALNRVGELLKLDRRVLVVTDEGVPSAYAETVAAACKTKAHH